VLADRMDLILQLGMDGKSRKPWWMDEENKYGSRASG
jgi:hypothetical protein